MNKDACYHSISYVENGVNSRTSPSCFLNQLHQESPSNKFFSCANNPANNFPQLFIFLVSYQLSHQPSSSNFVIPLPINNDHVNNKIFVEQLNVHFIQNTHSYNNQTLPMQEFFSRIRIRSNTILSFLTKGIQFFEQIEIVN